MTTTLADLRRESLAEQKADRADAETASALLETPLETPPVIDSQSENDAHLRIRADAQMLTQASTAVSEQLREQSSPQARTGASGQAREQVGKQVRSRSSKPARESGGEDVSNIPDVPLEEIVRAALGQKRQHPGGTKASVDMSPDLSLRIKRYGLDHGGMTSRQLFLELATAFLDREGY